MPLTAALSSVLIARRMASSLGWPPKIASSALRTMVLTRDRYIRLRRCLRSFDRIRFSDDLVFAKVTILPYNVALYNISQLWVKHGTYRIFGRFTPRSVRSFSITPARDYSRKP